MNPLQYSRRYLVWVAIGLAIAAIFAANSISQRLAASLVAPTIRNSQQKNSTSSSPLPTPTSILSTASPLPSPPPTPVNTPSAIIIAAGDIARCSSLSGAHATANLIQAQSGAQVIALGDLAYNSGTNAEFARCYTPTWGAFKDRTHPVPGNHEYRTAEAAGYFGYFDVPKYYSWDLGGWHFVALNSEIDHGIGSEQALWLQADLEASRAPCIVAYWHRPRFSSGRTHGSDASLKALWAILRANGATLVLSGHEHLYERFGPQDENGSALDFGMRQFVVGTGGVSFYEFDKVPQPNSEFRLTGVHGILRLELLPTSYRWEFVAVNGTVHDSGGDACVQRGRS